jgi:hypothetical protein
MGFIGKQPAKAAITSSDITDGVVTADKLASDSVTTAKIADNGVTTAKINADAVTDAKIADDVVGSEHLTAGEVDTTALGADAVTAAKIADDAISEEHLDATVITGMTELAAEPADTDEFLISDAGTLKRIDYSHIKGGGITVADQWRMNDTYSMSGGTDTVINQYWEQVDDTGKGTIGSAMTQSSGIFTFPATGIYRVHCGFRVEANATANYITCFIETTTDNSTYNQITEAYMSTSGGSAYQSGNSECLFDVDNTSNCKVRFVMRSSTNMTFGGNTDENHTYATFIRLGDT